MKFENQEVIDIVVIELCKTTDLNSRTISQHRCFLNYLRLVDKCYTLESCRVKEGIKGAWHHILPKSLYHEYIRTPKGVSNWNLVLMTHKEHFVAHHLLYEIYGRSGPMATSFRFICHNSHSREFCRKSNLDQLSKWKYTASDETRSRMSSSRRKWSHSEEARENMSKAQRARYGSSGKSRVIKKVRDPNLNMRSESQKGPLNHNYGKKASDETREKIRRARLGKVHEKKTCPYCGKIGGGPSMGRYHFDNCKSK